MVDGAETCGTLRPTGDPKRVTWRERVPDALTPPQRGSAA